MMDADLDLVEIREKSRVRNRMAMDMGTWVRELRSELDNYGEYFTADERKNVNTIIREAKKLAKVINGD